MTSSRRTGFHFVLLIVVFICQPVWGQPAEIYVEQIKIFATFVQTQMEADRTTGLPVAFMKDDFVKKRISTTASASFI